MENKENIDYKKIIEAVLFTWGDPLDIKEIARIIDLDKKATRLIVDEMVEEFNVNRGLKIVRIGDSFQLSTQEECFPWIQDLAVEYEKVKLSNAAIETLSIIAYKQPITRMEIEAIRGVKSDKVLDSLLTRSLVEEAGRLDQPGKPKIYRTTDVFLKFLSINSLDDLPEIEDREENIGSED